MSHDPHAIAILGLIVRARHARVLDSLAGLLDGLQDNIVFHLSLLGFWD